MIERHSFDPVALPPLDNAASFGREVILAGVEKEMLSCIGQFLYSSHPVFQVFLSSLREFIKNAYDENANQLCVEVEVLKDEIDEKSSRIHVKIKDNGNKAIKPVEYAPYDPWKNLVKASDKIGQTGSLGGNHYGLVFAAYALERYCSGQLALVVTPGEGATITLSGPLVKDGMRFTQDTANLVLDRGLSDIATFLIDARRKQILEERMASFNRRCEVLESKVSSEGRPKGFTLRFLVEKRWNALTQQQKADLNQLEQECGMLSSRLKNRPSMVGLADLTVEGLLCTDEGEPVTFARPPCRR